MDEQSNEFVFAVLPGALAHFVQVYIRMIHGYVIALAVLQSIELIADIENLMKQINLQEQREEINPWECAHTPALVTASRLKYGFISFSSKLNFDTRTFSRKHKRHGRH